MQTFLSHPPSLRIRNLPLLAPIPPINPLTLPPPIPRNAHTIKLLETNVPRQPLRRVAAPIDADNRVSELLGGIGGGAGDHETRGAVARAAEQFDRTLDVRGAFFAGGFAPL